MKNGWQTKSLGDVAQIGAGNSAPQGDEFFANGTHPFFRTSDAGRIRFGDIHEAADHLNDQGIKGLRRFPKGTILFPKSGASTFLNHRVMLGVEGFVSSHLATIVADKNKIDNRFLLYFLTTISAQDMIQDHAYPSLNLPIIAGIRVLVPPLPEQQRIVGILDEAFDGIATAKANAEKNLQNARALFESHLQSVFTQRGPGWVEKKMGEVCEVINGGTPKTGVPEYWDGSHLWITPAEMGKRPNPYVSDTERKITDLGLRDSSARMLPPNSVILSSRAPIGHLVINTQPMATNQGCKGLIPGGQLEHRFLFYYLSSIVDMLNSLGTGATFRELSGSKLKEVTMPVAPLAEQQRIAKMLDLLRAETQHLESIYKQKLTALEALKKSLLHQAFTGKL